MKVHQDLCVQVFLMVKISLGVQLVDAQMVSLSLTTLVRNNSFMKFQTISAFILFVDISLIQPDIKCHVERRIEDKILICRYACLKLFAYVYVTALSAGLPFLNPYKEIGADFSNGINFAVAGATALPVETLAAMNIRSPFTPSSLSVQLDWMASFFNSTCHSNKG